MDTNLETLETYKIVDKDFRSITVEVVHLPIDSSSGSYFIILNGRVNKYIAETYMFGSEKDRTKQKFDRKLKEYSQKNDWERLPDAQTCL